MELSRHIAFADYATLAVRLSLNATNAIVATWLQEHYYYEVKPDFVPGKYTYLFLVSTPRGRELAGAVSLLDRDTHTRIQAQISLAGMPSYAALPADEWPEALADPFSEHATRRWPALSDFARSTRYRLLAIGDITDALFERLEREQVQVALERQRLGISTPGRTPNPEYQLAVALINQGYSQKEAYRAMCDAFDLEDSPSLKEAYARAMRRQRKGRKIH
jgi:hypothetical protein